MCMCHPFNRDEPHLLSLLVSLGVLTEDGTFFPANKPFSLVLRALDPARGGFLECDCDRAFPLTGGGNLFQSEVRIHAVDPFYQPRSQLLCFAFRGRCSEDSISFYGIEESSMTSSLSARGLHCGTELATKQFIFFWYTEIFRAPNGALPVPDLGSFEAADTPFPLLPSVGLQKVQKTFLPSHNSLAGAKSFCFGGDLLNFCIFSPLSVCGKPLCKCDSTRRIGPLFVEPSSSS